MEHLDELVPTILIADDDELICMLVSRALRSRGFGVIVAHTRTESFDAHRATPHDLVILDAHMPGPNLEASLTSMALERSLPPVLVISGDTDRPGWLASHMGYLSKPFGLDDLFSEVTRLVGVPSAAPTSLTHGET